MNCKLLILLIFCTTNNCFGQVNKRLSALISFNVNATTYDRTKTNNSGGVGFGVLTIVGKANRLKALFEVGGDLFAGTKELYITSDGKPIDAKSGVLGFYGGPLLNLTPALFITAEAGASIYHSRLHAGLRPSIGLFPTKGKKWLIRTSFTHIFQRDEISREGFGYLGFSIALKLH